MPKHPYEQRRPGCYSRKPNKTVFSGQNTGTFDLSKHPDIVKQLLKDPNKWASILKSINYTVDDLAFRRQVVNNVLNELEKEHIINRDSVRSFRLNENEFIINDQRQPDNIFQQFKNKFIKEVGYAIYLGGATKGSNRGVFLPKDSL